MQKRWKILEADDYKVSDLREALKISPVVCKILVQRNILSFDDAKKYFRPQLEMLHDPWLMKDMQKAVDRIMKGFQDSEKILVFGDYDVDGTTSVACMLKFLQKHYSPGQVEFYIPHRYK